MLMPARRAKTFRDMAAWQLSFEIKEHVLKLLKAPGAARDFKLNPRVEPSVELPYDAAAGTHAVGLV